MAGLVRICQLWGLRYSKLCNTRFPEENNIRYGVVANIPRFQAEIRGARGSIPRIGGCMLPFAVS